MKKIKKKIIFFTGSRSDYFILNEVVKKIIMFKKIETSIYISGMHSLKEYGETKKDIRRYKNLKQVRTIKVYDGKNDYSLTNFIVILKKISIFLKIDNPDCIYILGDRFESMAASLAAYFLHIPIIHSGGGDVTLGSKDNIYRSIISSVSKIIFATSQKSFKTLKKIKFSSKIIFTGSPIVQKIYDFKKKKKLLKLNNFALMTFHPATNSKEKVEDLMKMTIKYLIQKGIKIVITYPNNESGSENILKIISEYSNNKDVIIFKNLSENYFNYLSKSLFLIGNSSSGIFEAPYFNKPFINIGSRQKNRETDSNVFSTGTSFVKVKKNINKFSKPHNIYNNKIFGDKNSVNRQLKEIFNYLK